MKVWSVVTLLGVSVAASLVSAQESPRLWYRGGFEGWVVQKTDPARGFYYRPSQHTAYPLNEAAYGQPIPCAKCGHAHWPGETACADCGCRCPAGGNREAKTTVYTPYSLPGMYFYEKQPHYRYSAPMRGEWLYRKYTQPLDF